MGETATGEEETGVAEERSFTEAEHEAIVADAVQREVASAVAERDEQVSELQGRIDVLEAERASAQQERDAARQELADYRAEVEREREITARQEERVARVRAAFASAPDDYFTEERIRRWAEMANEDFDALVNDLTGVAPAGASGGGGGGQPPTETAAFTGGQAPSDPGNGNGGNGQPTTLGKFLAARRG